MFASLLASGDGMFTIASFSCPRNAFVFSSIIRSFITIYVYLYSIIRYALIFKYGECFVVIVMFFISSIFVFIINRFMERRSVALKFLRMD